MVRLYRSRETGRDSDALGGKGTNLHYLTEHGLPVPAWVCVPFEHFDRFVTPFIEEIDQATAHLTKTNPSEVEETSRRIKTLFLSAEVDAALEAELSQTIAVDCPVVYAVRSSANQEDSSALSFAGLFDTYLNVQPGSVSAHVRKCWLSAFNPSAILYMRQNALSPSRVRMAVIIQEMVLAEKSGILFQANPQGRLDELVIVAGYGLGEGIVSGQVGSDTIYCDRFSKNVRNIIGTKSHRVDYMPNGRGGVETVPVEERLQGAPVLTEQNVLALRSMSDRLARIYDKYQDVEWAFDRDGTLWLLQSRPITTIPDGELQLYDNANIVESYPGISSPLTISVVRQAYEKMFYYAILHCGYPGRVLDRYASAFANLVENIEGRIYYNMTSWQKMMSVLPFASSLFLPALEDSIGTSRSNAARTSASDLRYWKVKGLCIFIIKYCFYGLFLRSYSRRYRALYAATKAAIEQTSDNVGLMRVLSHFLSRLFPIDQFGRISDAYLMIVLLLIKLFIKRRGLNDEEAIALVNGLLVGERDLESVKPVRSLRALAKYATQRPSLVSLLDSATSWDSLEKTLLAEELLFLTMIRDHLERYGDRTIAELKLETSTFRENPLRLMALISSCARGAVEQTSADAHEQRLREDAERRFFAFFSRVPDRLVARLLIGNLRKFIRSREFIRLNRARYYGLIRSIFLKITGNMVRQGVLAAPDDIFYLTHAEITGAIGGSSTEHFPGMVGERRAEWERLKQRRPANRLWLKGSVRENTIPQARDGVGAMPQEHRQAPGQQQRLKGTGCCPGRADAAAIVLLSPDYDADVNGRILVAENTDPGWVFLIMAASGLVMEKGSLLSHTAIIGREMGIPTIVGVRDATTLIRSNDRIAMDGSSGTITVLGGA